MSICLHIYRYVLSYKVNITLLDSGRHWHRQKLVLYMSTSSALVNTWVTPSKWPLNMTLVQFHILASEDYNFNNRWWPVQCQPVTCAHETFIHTENSFYNKRTKSGQLKETNVCVNHDSDIILINAKIFCLS